MKAHREKHRSSSSAWLRAAVLGADDGIVSVASLVVGVGSAAGTHHAVLVAGLAGAVAGAMSMAAGEFVSVSSQRDSEEADVAREKKELLTSPGSEQRELRDIYVDRGLAPELADEVATQLMAKDALGSHLRDELGLTDTNRARPTQAAFASAASFALGSLPPLVTAWFTRAPWQGPAVAVMALGCLAALGALGGRAGGASPLRAAARVCAGGGLAMAATALIGRLAGVAGL